jgi:acyl carrier protein
MELEAQIQQFVSQNLLFSDQGYRFNNNASFIQEGIIDSMGVMELATFVNTEFGIQVDPQDVTPENFDSVNKLAEYIRRKLAAVESKPAQA